MMTSFNSRETEAHIRIFILDLKGLALQACQMLLTATGVLRLMMV